MVSLRSGARLARMSSACTARERRVRGDGDDARRGARGACGRRRRGDRPGCRSRRAPWWLRRRGPGRVRAARAVAALRARLGDELPLVATGGLATGRGIAVVLAGGATAAQLGRRSCCAAKRRRRPRIATRSPTAERTPALTRAFTGSKRARHRQPLSARALRRRPKRLPGGPPPDRAAARRGARARRRRRLSPLGRPSPRPRRSGAGRRACRATRPGRPNRARRRRNASRPLGLRTGARLGSAASYAAGQPRAGGRCCSRIALSQGLGGPSGVVCAVHAGRTCGVGLG